MTFGVVGSASVDIGGVDTVGVKLKLLPPLPLPGRELKRELGGGEGVVVDWEFWEMVAICSWFFRISVFIRVCAIRGREGRTEREISQ